MIGNRVRVALKDPTEIFEGTLLRIDERGPIVHRQQGFDDDRRFFPMSRVIEIKDLGAVRG